MRKQADLLRLKADHNIGSGHVLVNKHRFSSYPLHWHDYFEIEFITEGIGTHIFNGEGYPLSKGESYLLTPVDFHEIEADSPVELINISFDETLLSEKMRTALYDADFSKLRKFEGDDYAYFVSAVQLLSRECDHNGPCIPQLLEYLLSRFLFGCHSGSALEQDHLAGMKAAVAYIELHFREKITLNKLSAISGYNPTYFSERFRKLTGETYLERLTALRINYAKALLANGLTVTDACFASGFGSLSNFLSVFKKRCGISPSEYREQYKKSSSS